jgi:hypothetical protein
MSRLINELEEERARLVKIILETEEIIQKAPKGNVRVSECKNSLQCYFYDEFTKEKNGKYMSKKERGKARKIVEREYREKLRNVCDRRKTEIEKTLRILQEAAPEKVFHSMARGKQRLLSNVIMDDEEYAKVWMSKTYSGKDFPDNYPEIVSDRGERVRSKTEKIIADKLLRERIPYRYEHPVCLEGFGVVYPDFTLLNTNTRKEVLLEHFGMMSDMCYVQKALRKLHWYEKNGYFVGKNLLITYETATQPFDAVIFENMLKGMGFCGESW